VATNKVDYARRARIHLSKADPILARIIAEVGALGIQPRRERFQALARAIIFQQLAGAAANAIYGRFVALFPGVEFPSPEQVLAKLSQSCARWVYLKKKALYIRDLAEHIRDGKTQFSTCSTGMTDEEIIDHLIMVKGIGRWTAEMFLMFNLGRPDVMPARRPGVQNAIRRHYKMRQRPNRKRLLKHAERWRPYRTAAAMVPLAQPRHRATRRRRETALRRRSRRGRSA